MGKGDGFERDVCRELSLWWTEDDRDDVLWRNRVKITSKTPNRERQLGDITSTHTISLPLIEVFNIEVKTGYSKTRSGKRTKNIPWDILDIIDGKEDGVKVLLTFWKQCKEDAEVSKRIPLLIFKRDYHTPCVCMRRSDANRFILYVGTSPASLFSRLTLKTNEEKLDMYRMTNFFNWITPGAVRLFHRAL